MGEPSSPGQSITKEGSFSKFLRSPGRAISNSKKSSSPLSKLLRRRRSSRRDGGDDDDGDDQGSSSAISVESIPEEQEAPSLIDEVKEVVVDTAIDHVFHHDNKQRTSVDQTNGSAPSIESKDETSSGQSITKEGSFTKFLHSPSRAISNSKKSSSPLSKLLHRRRSSRRDGGDDDDDDDQGSSSAISVESIPEEQEAPSLIDEVKEVVVDTAIDHVFHHDKQHTSVDQTNGSASSIESKDETSTETEESKRELLDKFKEELGKAKEEFKAEYSKGKEQLETLMHKEDSPFEHPQTLNKDPEIPISTDYNNPEIPISTDNEVKVPVPPTVDSEKGETCHCCQEGESKQKKEENCMSSLAKGLQKLCAPWGSNKED